MERRERTRMADNMLCWCHVCVCGGGITNVDMLALLPITSSKFDKGQIETITIFCFNCYKQLLPYLNEKGIEKNVIVK